MWMDVNNVMVNGIGMDKFYMQMLGKNMNRIRQIL